jgi:hypothetical protein
MFAAGSRESALRTTRPVPSYFFAGALAGMVAGAVAGAFAISLRTVFEGCAPFLIHASTFTRSIDTVGGSVIGL